MTGQALNVFIGIVGSNAVESSACTYGKNALGFNEKTAMVRNMSTAQNPELAKLQGEYRQLQDQVNAQAWELSQLRARFARYETALRGSKLTVYTQDRDLRYTSLSNSMLGRSVEDILGRTDVEVLPSDGAAAMIAESAGGTTPTPRP